MGWSGMHGGSGPFSRVALSLAGVLLVSCGGAPEAPTPASVTPPSAQSSDWNYFSDAERIHALSVSPSGVWAAAQVGVVSWDRQRGTFRAEPDAPAERVTAIAVSSDGQVFVGLRRGLAWRGPDSKWNLFDEGPMRGGVTALAPRRAGGVWVGTATTLGFFDRGTLSVVSHRYRVRAIVAARDGIAWVATHRFGVVAVQGNRLVEYTSGQGVCGNSIASVRAGGGRVTAVCADGGAKRFSLWHAGRWYSYALEETGSLVDVGASANRILAQTGRGWWWLDPAGPPVAAKPGVAPRGPRVQSVASTGAEPPPPPPPPKPPAAKPLPKPEPKAAPKKPTPEPVGPAKKPAFEPPPLPPPAGSSKDAKGTQAPAPTTQPAKAVQPAKAPASQPAKAAPAKAAPAKAAPAKPKTGLAKEMEEAMQGKTSPEVVKPPPVPMPKPIGPGLRPKVVELKWLSVRAPVGGSAAGGPRWKLAPARLALPKGSEVSTWSVGSDGTLWFALAYRGLASLTGTRYRRYTSLTLVPREESTRLGVDAAGRVLITQDAAQVLRYDGKRWSKWRAIREAQDKVLSTGRDAAGRTYALALHQPKTPKPAPDPARPPAFEGAPTPPPITPQAPPPPVLRILRTGEGAQGDFVEISRVNVKDVDGPPRVGRVVVDATGALYFPMFWLDKGLARRGAGLAHVPAHLGQLQVWKGGLGELMSEDSATPSLPDAYVSAVALHTDGTVYVGTNAGLVRIRGKATRVFDENDFIESEVITDVAIDGTGRVWAGTLEGLGYLEGDAWKTVKDERFIGRIGTLRASPDGSLWVGTPEGLFRNTGGKWTEISRRGRSMGALRDLVHGPDGTAWILTEQGVFSFRD